MAVICGFCLLTLEFGFWCFEICVFLWGVGLLLYLCLVVVVDLSWLICVGGTGLLCGCFWLFCFLFCLLFWMLVVCLRLVFVPLLRKRGVGFG